MSDGGGRGGRRDVWWLRGVFAGHDSHDIGRQHVATFRAQAGQGLALADDVFVGAVDHGEADVEDFGRPRRQSIDVLAGGVLIDGKRSCSMSADAVLIPAGARHHIMNTGKETLHVYTLYAPPEHRDRTVHATKDDAETSLEHFDGKTTE